MSRKKIPATEEVTCDICKKACTVSNFSMQTQVAITQCRDGGGGTNRQDWCDRCTGKVMETISMLESEATNRR